MTSPYIYELEIKKERKRNATHDVLLDVLTITHKVCSFSLAKIYCQKLVDHDT